jgi:hypothetical protein
MVLRRTQRRVYRVDMAKLRAKWLTPRNSFGSGSILVAALVPCVVKALAAHATIGSS